VADFDPSATDFVSAIPYIMTGVKTMYTRPRDVKRTEGTKPERVQPFYQALKDLQHRYQHHASTIFNMDKTGFPIGNVQRGKGVIYRNAVSATAAGKRAHALQAKQLPVKWITSIECITAAGKPLNPLHIFKGQKVNQAWMLGDQDWRRTHGWHYAAPLKGWSNNDLGFQWLRNVFDPQTRLPNRQHRLLILDGHCSHLSARFFCYCHDHDIDLLFLPSHTSHVLRPLDIGVFKERKKVICQAAKDRWRLLADGDRFSKRDFILDLAEAREKAMTGKHIIKGWCHGSESHLYRQRAITRHYSELTQVYPILPEHIRQYFYLPLLGYCNTSYVSVIITVFVSTLLKAT
jgi:hypothetical protein